MHFSIPESPNEYYVFQNNTIPPVTIYNETHFKDYREALTYVVSNRGTDLSDYWYFQRAYNAAYYLQTFKLPSTTSVMTVGERNPLPFFGHFRFSVKSQHWWFDYKPNAEPYLHENFSHSDVFVIVNFLSMSGLTAPYVCSFYRFLAQSPSE